MIGVNPNDYDFDSMTEQELAGLSAQVPDEIFLAALDYSAAEVKVERLWYKLSKICRARNVDVELALAAVFAVEQSNLNEREED